MLDSKNDWQMLDYLSGDNLCQGGVLLCWHGVSLQKAKAQRNRNMKLSQSDKIFSHWHCLRESCLTSRLPSTERVKPLCTLGVNLLITFARYTKLTPETPPEHSQLTIQQLHVCFTRLCRKRVGKTVGFNWAVASSTDLGTDHHQAKKLAVSILVPDCGYCEYFVKH